MSKLTLEQLAPYLPYGLKFKRVDGENIFQAYGVDCQQGMWLNTCGHGIIEINGTQLLLRPMSDLTRKITIEGEEKIPLLILANICIKHEDVNWQFDEKERLVFAKSKDDFNYVFFYNETKKSFHFNSIVGTPNQLELFQWLFKHKFDVFNGIGTWAIDVNTLTENIY